MVVDTVASGYRRVRSLRVGLCRAGLATISNVSYHVRHMITLSNTSSTFTPILFLGEGGRVFQPNILKADPSSPALIGERGTMDLESRVRAAAGGRPRRVCRGHAALPAHGLRLRAVVRARPRAGRRRRPGSLRRRLVRPADPRRPGRVRRLASGHRATPRAPGAAPQAARGAAARRRRRRGRRRAGPDHRVERRQQVARRPDRHRRLCRDPSAKSSRCSTCTTAPSRTSPPSWACRSRR